MKPKKAFHTYPQRGLLVYMSSVTWKDVEICKCYLSWEPVVSSATCLKSRESWQGRKWLGHQVEKFPALCCPELLRKHGKHCVCLQPYNFLLSFATWLHIFSQTTLRLFDQITSKSIFRITSKNKLLVYFEINYWLENRI